jgi:hypothetical protein
VAISSLDPQRGPDEDSAHRCRAGVLYDLREKNIRKCRTSCKLPLHPPRPFALDHTIGRSDWASPSALALSGISLGDGWGRRRPIAGQLRVHRWQAKKGEEAGTRAVCGVRCAAATATRSFSPTRTAHSLGFTPALPRPAPANGASGRARSPDSESAAHNDAGAWRRSRPAQTPRHDHPRSCIHITSYAQATCAIWKRSGARTPQSCRQPLHGRGARNEERGAGTAPSHPSAN